MNHEQWESQRSRYQKGEMGPDERTAFEARMEELNLTPHDVEEDLVLAGALRSVFDDAYPADFEERTLALVRESTVADLVGSDAASEDSGKITPLRNFWSWLRSGELRIPVPVALAASVLLLIAGGLAIRGLTQGGNGTGPVTVADLQPLEMQSMEAGAIESEVRSLLTRARTLLLALSTARPDEEGRYFLAAEEALSRDLIQEVRLLESNPELDDRTEVLELVQDLEAILLDVSTWQGVADSGRLAVVQGGIDDRSLIFRLNNYAQEFGGN